MELSKTQKANKLANQYAEHNIKRAQDEIFEAVKKGQTETKLVLGKWLGLAYAFGYMDGWDKQAPLPGAKLN